ncbi:lipoprotein insertase outer membrane protein LolB [Bordetella sp. BOR01]|uniref:lipoprotein insertase outer membrane protein LolB n=1 Tax=Bordetella sp. BOR01 TaxID=2854779 RepID=UPI001C447B5A|nr:lipoprotein insertase outer membrane protein LolB [Bordetella sp. BOR01]MBV7483665.1 lipoprotein insertase outer membrane protein LolB [Bordetella sp. BOR01]
MGAAGTVGRAARRHAWLRGWLAAGLCALLAACASVPDAPPGTADGAFVRSGRFAITVTEVSGQQQAVQGGFTWRDDGGQYQLDLTNPLGSTEARVAGQPGHATLTKADGTVLQADTPDALAEEALGGPVPVSSLRDWLRGRVAGDAPVDKLQRDAQGRPVAFEQDGWQARLSRYDDQGPGLLVLQRTEPGRRIVVRLAVSQP